jgi:chaperonin GroES
MNNGIKPRNDFVLVRREKAEEKTEGGILLPDTAQEKPLIATVLDVGPGSLQASEYGIDTADLRPGMRVIVGRYSGSSLNNDSEVILVRQDEIMAIIEGTE